MKAGLKIIFMGTPDFAKGVLQEILESTHEVLAVVTAPDRPAGRGQKAKEKFCKALCREKMIFLFFSLKN